MSTPRRRASTPSRSASSTPTLPTAKRVPHTRVRLGVSKNIIYSTYHHVVELYGPQMPVLVAESINCTPGARATASVNVNFEIAWAWYVFSRRLLVWRIPSYTDSTLTVIAKDMQLPSSDLAHHANLVTLFPVPNQYAPSCIAVSPEGIIRYWEVVGYHSSWVDVNANLGGEEVCEVHYIPPIGCLAVTTSGSMIIITPTVIRGNATVTTRHVSQLPGWFDNIGRKMSSMIFGASNSSEDLDNKLVRVVTSVRVPGYWSIIMLDGFTLQSWAIQSEGVICNHLYECNIEPLIRSVFPAEVSEDPECEIIITDARPSAGGTIVVLAVSPEPRHYIIVEVNGDDLEQPDAATKLCVLSRGNISVLEGPEGNVAHLKFILLPTTALVFNKQIIYAVPLSAGEECDGEPLDMPGGVVLGGIMHKTTPVFFSATFGFVSITPVNTSCIDVINTEMVQEQRTPQPIKAREPVAPIQPQYVYHIKTAFLHYIRKNLNLSIQVLMKEFPYDDHAPMLDSELSTALVKISLEIVNDTSHKDHRWGDVKEAFLFTSTRSLHLNTQMAEKQQAHDMFLKFARDISHYLNLGMVTRKGNPVGTIHIIYEHNEKIVACICLKILHTRFPLAVSYGIGFAAYSMSFTPCQQISCYDFFFRYMSISDLALRSIISKCVKLSWRQNGSARSLKCLLVSNEIIILVLHSILDLRSDKGYFIDVKHIPWLAAPEPAGIFDHLSALANVTHDFLCRFGRHTPRFRTLIGQFFKLCNILMYVRFEHADPEEFNNMTSAFIQFFVDFKYLHDALQLAYKYKNFEYLVKLTYITRNEGCIPNFIAFFGDEGFCYYLFKYLYAEKKYSELMHLDLPDKYICQLESFIQDIPTLDLLYKLRTGRYKETNQILAEFDKDESFTLQEQEMMYSIRKLTALASPAVDVSTLKEGSSDGDTSTTDTSPRLWRDGDLIDAIIDGYPESSTPSSVGRSDDLPAGGSDELPPGQTDDLPPGSPTVGLLTNDLVNDMNKKLEIILAQKRIPHDAFTRKGYDIGSVRMLPPSELIELYTGDANIDANEIHFKRALDLLPLIDDTDERDAMRIKIWKRAIERDDWASLRKDLDPELVEDLLFFRFMKLVITTSSDEEDIPEIIPPAEVFLDDPELKIFTKDSLQYYLLEYGYEAVMGVEGSQFSD